MVTKEKILYLSKILKSFVDTQKVNPLCKRTKKNYQEFNSNNNIQSDSMVVDDDNLEYSKLTKNYETLNEGRVLKNEKKVGFSLFDLKN